MATESDRGATSAEYAIMLAGIAAVIVLAIVAYGVFLHGKWTGTTSEIETKVTTLSAS